MSKKSLDLLTEEDRFIYRLSFTERLSTKLNVMNYIGNYFDNIHLITPVSLLFLWPRNFELLHFISIANPSSSDGLAFDCAIEKTTEIIGDHSRLRQLFE